MRKLSWLKYTLMSLSLFAAISTVGFSLWIFSLSETLGISSPVIVDDIYENWNFTNSIKENPSIFKQVESNKSNNEYKLLGGYSSSGDALSYSSTETYEFTEFNFFVSDTTTMNTVDANYGRLYYIDRAYFSERSGENRNSIDNLSGTFNGYETTFSMSAKESGFLISKDKNKENVVTDSWLTIRNQKNAIGSDYYAYFQKNILDPVNTVVWNTLGGYYFAGGTSSAKPSDDANDNKTTFNGGSSNYTVSNISNSSLTASKLYSDLNNRMFTPGSNAVTEYGYYNILLFVPFKRTYSSDTSGNVTSSVVTDSDGSPIEDDVSFVALKSSSSESKIGSYIKIIDYSGVNAAQINSGKVTIPTIFNGGFSLTSGGFVSKDNFVDNGNLFVDRLNLDLDGNPIYRPVFGVSNNIDSDSSYSYPEPTYSDSSRKYYLGSVAYNVFSWYNRGDEYGSDYADRKLGELSTLPLSNIIDSAAATRGLHLLNHLTYAEVDLVSTVVETTSGTVTTSETQYGINFEKSMILLLLPSDISTMPS